MGSSELTFSKVFWMLLVSATFVGRSIANIDCGNVTDCNMYSGFICALNKENICFRRFTSECEMKRAVCNSTKEFAIYDTKFCDLTGFMCLHEYKEYNANYAKNENMDAVVYSIYAKNSAKKN